MFRLAIVAHLLFHGAHIWQKVVESLGCYYHIQAGPGWLVFFNMLAFRISWVDLILKSGDRFKCVIILEFLTMEVPLAGMTKRIIIGVLISNCLLAIWSGFLHLDDSHEIVVLRLIFCLIWFYFCKKNMAMEIVRESTHACQLIKPNMY